MKRLVVSVILLVIFLSIVGEQFYKNYQFRIQAPSEKWAKETVISKGKLKNSPKVIKYEDKYIVAHDDEDKIKIISVDSLGNRIGEKNFNGEDKVLFDVNLLTDNSFLYVNWISSKNGKNRLVNLKLDKEFREIERTYYDNPKSSIQISDCIYAVSYEDRIEIVDIKTGKKSDIEVMQSSKLCSTNMKDGYLISYYNRYGFHYAIFKDGKLSDPKLLSYKWPSYGEIYLDTAIACDEEYAYLIVDRKIKKDYGLTMMLAYKLDGSGEEQLIQVGTRQLNIGSAKEMNILSLVNTDFTYAPVGISSGSEARFMIGTARPYGRSERQFDVLEFGVRDGKLTYSNYMDNSRYGTILSYQYGDVGIYCNQIRSGYYNVCFTSTSEVYKSKHNVPRSSEVGTAMLDTLSNIANSIFGVMTIGLKWILPGLMLISIATFLGHKLTENKKKIVFLFICLITMILKTLFAKSLFYGDYIYALPQTLSSTALGIGIFISISSLCYWRGYMRYKGRLLKNPDDLPILAFVIALFTDSILTQLIYTPFIM